MRKKSVDYQMSFRWSERDAVIFIPELIVVNKNREWEIRIPDDSCILSCI